MPPSASSRPAKAAPGKGAKAAAKNHKKQPNKAAPAAGSSAPTASTGTAALPERNPKGVPAPAAVLMQALGIPLSGTAEGDTVTTAISGSDSGGKAASADHSLAAAAAAVGPSPMLAGMEVDVETRQGYAYTGKLAMLDAHYNVLLHESLVRRARAFDYDRAAKAERQQREARLLASSLQDSGMGAGMFYDDGVSKVPSSAQLQAHLPRPRYIGTVTLRSNNVVMMRFIEPAAAGNESAWGRLQSSFSAMAAAIKAHLQRERMRRRAARRQRLEAKKK